MKRLDTKYIVAIIISIIGACVLGYGYMNYQSKVRVLEEETKTKEAKQQQYLDCAEEANQMSRDFFKKKIGLMEELGQTNTEEYKRYKVSYDAGLILIKDYDNYYKNCLNRYGLEPTIEGGEK